MAQIVHLHGDPHEQAQSLLPWYVTGTLDEADAAIVEAHLAECGDCRAELETERVLRKRIAGLAVDVDHGWDAMRERIARPRGAAAMLPMLRRRVPLGWAVAVPLAAGLAMVIALPTIRQAPVDSYRTLGSAPTAPQGNVIVLFAPDISARAMRDAFSGVGARVVDGPMASGAYLVHVPAEGRVAALGRLRSTAKVVLAEPVDAGGQP